MSVETSPELPSYDSDDSFSKSLPSPSYSCQLASGEQRLDYTSLRAPQSRTNSVFIKKSGELSIVVNEQEEDATIPVFGRHAVISGIVLCQGQLEKIRKIVLKVEGKLDSSTSGGGSWSIKLISSYHTLWSHLTSEKACPSQVPFAITLPATFQDDNNSFPLPPSYHFVDDGIQTLLARSSYQLRFIVTHTRHPKIDAIWPKEQRMIIPFKYVPRTRAPRPSVATSCLFSSIKTSPEEWYQAVTYLKMRPNVEITPIICHLFVPGGRIYALTDTMKFHVQLAGLTCSLYMLLSGAHMDLDRIASVDSDSPTTERNFQNEKPLVRVTLLRQVSVTVRREKAWSNSILGEGTIWPVPPDLSNCCATLGRYSEGSIDWEGEVRCQSNVTVGGFNAANVQVKDFIVLEISPPTPKSPLLDLKLNVPIRLVTDSFLDMIAEMDSAAR
ncbi:hypothetical protein BYT27DRAFT_7122833 [Phlegmacium glaucopus]|nr:hypothetical protein BYT27DRAFT_7122833 [Phlegmacium glaucopus]